MLTPEKIEHEFGSKWCERALFYSYPNALRFELGTGEHPIDRFLSAHKRALDVVQEVFSDVDDIRVAVQVFAESESPGVISLLQCFRGLRDCGLPLPHRDAIKTSQSSYDEESRYCVMVMPIRQADLARALWPPLGHDFRIEPRLSACVYILSKELGILVHPYDDRGMDIIGPNKSKLSEVYDRYRSWLLAHDLDVMDRSFANPKPSDEGASS